MVPEKITWTLSAVAAQSLQVIKLAQIHRLNTQQLNRFQYRRPLHQMVLFSLKIKTL